MNSPERVMEQVSTMQGEVVAFYEGRAFGWIRADTGVNGIFFQLRDFVGKPAEGQRVQFELSNGPKGPRATNVVPVP